MPEGYLSDNEGVEGEHDQLNKPRTTNAPKKKAHHLQTLQIPEYHPHHNHQFQTTTRLNSQKSIRML